ncbi:UNVERIFIED_CONTAM: hypothetical protein GTU68_039148 [Idotea baltica]|nr:hypothetical protein [Idotea baltica]
MTKRVHITGGSGSGTTTLGTHLARALDASHMDADDFFWVPSDPPYVTQRPVSDRLALMEQMFLGRDKWVLSGSVMGWGDPLIPHFDLVIRLEIPAEIRLARLKEREARAYGARIEAGGDMAERSAAFMEWAAGYDDPAFTGRARAGHINWCEHMPCPVLTLDSTGAIDDLVVECLREFEVE